MRIRTLLQTALTASLLLTVGLLFGIWSMGSHLDRLALTQQRALDVVGEVSSLQVLTNEYALNSEERVVQQWLSSHERVIQILSSSLESDPTTPAVALEEAKALPQFFNRLTETADGADQNLQRRRTRLLLGQLLTHTQSISDTVNRWADTASTDRLVLEHRFQILSMAVPIIILLVLAALVTLLVLRVLRPLFLLHKSVQSFARGDLSARCTTNSKDEMGDLARTFDAMASSRQVTEAELRDGEANLKYLLNEMPVGVCLVDAIGRIYFRNKFCMDVFGYTESDAPTLDTWRLHAFPDPTYSKATQGSWSTLMQDATGVAGAIPVCEYQMTTKHGSVRDVDVSRITFGDHLLLTFVDQTVRKQHVLKLQETTAVAEAANLAKSSFLATMSHEIRTPMNGILGMLQLLQHTELTSRQSDYTRKAEGATLALLGIINDILDFSKVEAGKLELDNQPLVIGDLLRELSVILSANLGSKNVEILFKLASDVPPIVIGDALRLRQVLINLAGNALKFTEQGEVVLGIRLLKRDADQVELEFSILDTGIGIAADKLGYIFEGFSQAESTTSRRFGGTGLGLAISQRLVALMGGTLAVESEFGKGSRFFFNIRVGVGSAMAAATASPHAVPAGASPLQALLTPGGVGLRVLVVDDNALSREILNEMAIEMGWQVKSVVSGEAALAHLEQGNAPHYDIVLMDWRMPGMDGWEATRKIRKLRQGGQALVVIMVTAASRELLNKKSRLETDLIDSYLVKPITASMLYEAVAEAIAKRRGEHIRRSEMQASTQLDGLRLLVVEDNLLNQQIARELLERCGAQIAIATGGLDGVEQALAADPPFDAILMDVQMPDIDGLEATRRIRSEPRMCGVPIIAMTANAMEADKEACRAVGMVDHVAKPVDLNTLIDTVLRHAGHQRTGALPKPAPAIAEPAAAIAASLIDIDAAVNRMGGNREFYDKMVFGFRSDAALLVAELQGHIRLGGYAQAIRSAHTLRGLAATVGAVALSAQVQRIETMVKHALADASTQTTATLADMSTDLASQLALVLAAMPQSLQRPMSQVDDSVPEILDGGALATALQELAALLKLRDMRATIVGDKLRRKFGGNLDAVQLEQLSSLEQALAQIDFARAIDACNVLRSQLPAT